MTDHRIFGREAEVQTLAALVDRTRQGAGDVAFIEGQAGIGKSRLLAEARNLAGEAEMAVVWGECRELERARPFGALADALDLRASSPDDQRAEIGTLLASPASGGTVSGVDVGHRVLDLILDLLQSMASKTGLLLALDDVHWSDPSTLLAASAVVRRLSPVPVCLVATLRPLPRRPELERLIDVSLRSRGCHLPLAPLSTDAVAGLAEELLDASPGPGLRGQLARAGGNPLFVMELLAALREEGFLDIVDGRADSQPLHITPTLRVTVLRRLSFLPAGTLDILRLGAVLGGRFTLTDLSTVVDRSAVALLTDLQPALQAGLLGESGHVLAFRHDLIRDALYEDLPMAVRKGLHVQAGRAFAAAAAPALRVAEQLSLGAETGDTEAVKWLRKAGREAACTSTEAGVDLLERALALSEPSDPRRDQLGAELAPLLVMVGRVSEGRALADHVLAGDPDPSRETLLRVALANVLLRQANIAAAVEQFERAGAVVPDPFRYMVLSAAAISRTWMGDMDGGTRMACEIRVPAERDDNQFALVQVFETLSYAAAAAGSSEESVQFAHQAIEAAARDTTSNAAFTTPHALLAEALIGADELEKAEGATLAGIRRTEQLGTLSWLPMYHAHLPVTHFLAGHWDDAVAAAETALTLMEQLEARWSLSVVPVTARIALARNDLAEMARQIDRIQQEMAVSEPFVPTPAALGVKALLFEARGDMAAAAFAMRRAWDVLPAVRYLSFNRWLLPDAVRIALAVDDVKGARAIAADAEQTATASSVNGLRALALRCRGLVDHDADALVQAVDLYRATPRAFETAAAAEDAGLALAGRGDHVAARPLLDQALTIYETLLATREAARVTAAMRRLGLRRGSKAPRSRPTIGWASLTPAEIEIARLVAEGLSNTELANRAFVSRYTVETHLKHIFRKLNVASRSELAVETVRRADS